MLFPLWRDNRLFHKVKLYNGAFVSTPLSYMNFLSISSMVGGRTLSDIQRQRISISYHKKNFLTIPQNENTSIVVLPLTYTRDNLHCDWEMLVFSFRITSFYFLIRSLGISEKFRWKFHKMIFKKDFSFFPGELPSKKRCEMVSSK